MLSLVAPALFVLLVWWASTAVILYLDGLPPRTFARSFTVATLLALVAAAGLAHASRQSEVLAAYQSFACAIVVWGWLEASLLFGYVTGPRKAPCDPALTGWRRFRQAFSTLAYHELALCAGALVVVALGWDGRNQVGTWTYLILWAMRTSAKLNVFLGVRNLAEELLPPHLRYLESYFRRAPMNVFFPFAVTAGTAVTALVLRAGLGGASGEFEGTSALLAGSLLALGVLEHWFLVLPASVNALWSWGLKSHARTAGGRARVRAASAPRLALVPLARPEVAPEDLRRP